MLRVGAAILCGLFLLATAVQLDDPDALRWIAIYGLAAGLAGLGAAGRFPLVPNALALAVFAALFLAWSPSLLDARREAFASFGMRAARDEEPREAVGLLLCAGWSAVQTLGAWRRSGGGARRRRPGATR